MGAGGEPPLCQRLIPLPERSPGKAGSSGMVFWGTRNLEGILRTVFLKDSECTHRLSESPAPHRCLLPKANETASLTVPKPRLIDQACLCP